MKMSFSTLVLGALPAGMASTQTTTLNTVGWNPDTLQDIRNLLAGDSLPEWAQGAKDMLSSEAASRMSLPGRREGVGTGPWTVGGQGPDPPADGTSTSHDYHTVSGYYWPCYATCPSKFTHCAQGWDQDLHDGECDAASGIPWIKHDGFLRDENLEDLYTMINMMDTAEVLALAWWLLPEHDVTYAQTAVEVLGAWFWDESTGMEPRLEYGGAQPGIYNGTAGASIAFSYRLGTRLSDTMELLKTADADVWTAADAAGWADWSGRWVEWMTTSEFGRIELGAVGNHATFLYSHKLAMAKATGDDALVLDVVAGLRTREAGSLAWQIEPSGEMPIETARPTSKTYSIMNLNGLFLLGVAVENACRGLSCSSDWDWSWEVTSETSGEWDAYENTVAGCKWKETISNPSTVQDCKTSCLEHAECNAVVSRQTEKYGLYQCYLQKCLGTAYDHSATDPPTQPWDWKWTSHHYVAPPEVGTGSVRKALDFVLPYATGSKSWSEDFPYSLDGSNTSRDLALPLRIAAGKYDDYAYEADISLVDPLDWFSYTFDSLLFPPPGSL